ncbi:MAG: hypothetical protein GXZ08_09395 [Tissierellia bacterium]|nr:hypothetical protein [Tissierellia bacterium]
MDVIKRQFMNKYYRTSILVSALLALMFIMYAYGLVIFFVKQFYIAIIIALTIISRLSRYSVQFVSNIKFGITRENFLKFSLIEDTVVIAVVSLILLAINIINGDVVAGIANISNSIQFGDMRINIGMSFIATILTLLFVYSISNNIGLLIYKSISNRGLLFFIQRVLPPTLGWITGAALGRIHFSLNVFKDIMHISIYTVFILGILGIINYIFIRRTVLNLDVR